MQHAKRSSHLLPAVSTLAVHLTIRSQRRLAKTGARGSSQNRLPSPVVDHHGPFLQQPSHHRRSFPRMHAPQARLFPMGWRSSGRNTRIRSPPRSATGRGHRRCRQDRKLIGRAFARLAAWATCQAWHYRCVALICHAGHPGIFASSQYAPSSVSKCGSDHLRRWHLGRCKRMELIGWKAFFLATFIVLCIRVYRPAILSWKAPWWEIVTRPGHRHIRRLAACPRATERQLYRVVPSFILSTTFDITGDAKPSRKLPLRRKNESQQGTAC